MRAIVATIRAELRHRWRRWLGLAVIYGIASGLVLGAATGARRTDSAYPRLLKASHPFDYAVANVPDPSVPQLDIKKLSELPFVAETSAFNFYGTPFQTGQPIAPADDRFGRTFNTFYVVHGRLYNPAARDEAIISEFTARKNHIHVGQVITIPFGSAEFKEPSVPVKIVGTMIAAQAFPPRPAGRGDPIFLSPAFSAAHPDLFHLTEVLFSFRHGAADDDAFKRVLSQMTHGLPLSFFIEARDQDRNTERSIHVQAIALWVLAGLVGMAMLAALGQGFSRQMYLEAEEHPALRAVGMTKAQLWSLGMSRAAVIGLAAALVAIVAGVGLSWFTPIGIARLAELHKGFEADWVVLSIGFAGVIVVACVLAAWPAWRNAVDTAVDEVQKPSLGADAAARAGLSPSTVSGIRLALERGRGRTSVPVRSTALGVAIGIAAVVTSLGFAINLSHLLHTPAHYGWNWDRLVTTENENLSDVETKAVLNAPGADASDLGATDAPITIDGKPSAAIIADPPTRGTRDIVPVLTGRIPTAIGEILLGSKTLQQLHKHIGDRVHVTVFGGITAGETFRVVGTGVLPPVSDTAGLGTGAVFTYSNASQLIKFGGPAGAPDTIFIHFARGVNQRATIASLQRRYPDLTFQAESLPPNLADFGGVRALPFVMAALLASLALMLMIHTLVSSIRRRRRDLAILRTLGFSGRQLRSTVAWQASILTLVSLLIGLPFGAIGARLAWQLFASNLGVVPDTLSPVAAMLILIPAALLVANLIAAYPGRAAARVQPARVLRTE